MPNQKTDKQGYSTVNPDTERDMASKGGPTTSLGNADDAHDVPHPYDEDTQTQLAAKSTEKKKSGETLNDDWKTGTDKKELDKNMNKGKTPGNRKNDQMKYDSGSVNPNPNYDRDKQMASNTGSMRSKESQNMDEE